MNPYNFDKAELKEFLGDESDRSPIDSAAPGAIVKDLVLSKGRLSLVYVTGSVVGYLLSLVICAQCSIGLSPLSWKTASFLHAIPDPWCPILCGSIFGISPTFVSTLYFSRFQHRFLIFRMGWLPALVPIIGSLSLFLFGDAHSWEWRILWLLSAILVPYLVEIVSALFLRQGHWRADAAKAA